MPGVNALQLTLQPGVVEPLSPVTKKRFTVLLVLVIMVGRVEPQRFFIKVVPSPSVIVRWSQSQVEWDSMLNAVKCKEITNPCPTFIVSVHARLFG